MANNTLIGALRAEATLESGKFVDGAKKIRSEAKKTETQLKTSFGNMGTSVKGFGTALSAGLSIGLLSATIKKGLDYASSLKTISQQAGVTTRDLQTLRYAATQNGLTVFQLDDGLTKLKDTMGKVAAGAAAPTKAFNAIGISAEQLSKLDPSAAFKLISDKLSAIPDPAKRAAFELAIFGEAGSKLDPLLAKGSGAMNELAKAAQELGIVLSDSQIQNADETAAKLDQVKMVLAAQISGVVADNANSIVSLSSALASLTGSILNFLNSNPMAAVGILGALAGGRVGGLPGAAIGGFAGLVAGANYSSEKQFQSVRAQGGPLLRHNFIKSVDRAKALRQAGDTKGANAEYARAKRLRDKYLASGGEIPGYNPAPVGGTIPQFLAPAGPKPRKTRTPRARKGPRDRSDDATYQVEQELRRADMDILRAKQSLAHGSAEQTALALQMLDLEKAQFDAEQARKVDKAKRDLAEGRITQAAYDEVVASTATLKAKYDEKDALERRALLEEQQLKLDEAAYNLGQTRRDLALDDLHAAEQLATTAAERRAIGMAILNSEIEQKRLALEHEKQMAIRNGATADEIAAIQARIDHLEAERAQGGASVAQGTRGPLESYLAGLPTDAAKMEEALQQVKVNGLDAVTQGLMDVISGTESAGEAFKKFAQQVIADLLRIMIQRTIISAIGNALMPGGGGMAAGLAGGGMASGAGIFGAALSTPRFASGGSMRIRGIPGIDRNVLQLNGMPIARVSHNERIDVSNDNGRGRGGGAMPAMHFHFGPGTSDRDARRTGMQAAAAFRQESARSAKKGF